MTAPQTTSASYEVGYGKPPRHTQFKKGQSGNPGGRPRGRPAGRFQELALQEAYRAVVVMEYGHAVPVPAIQAVLRSQMELAASGNVRAQRAILAMIRDIEQEAGPDSYEPVGGDDDGDADAGNGTGEADDPGVDDQAGIEDGTGPDPARPGDGETDADEDWRQDDWRQQACERAAGPPPVERWREPPSPEPPPPPVVPWRERPRRPGLSHRHIRRGSEGRERR